MVWPPQGHEDLVAVAGNEALERISTDDETDRRLHRLQQFVRRRTRVEVPGQGDGRSSAVFFGLGVDFVKLFFFSVIDTAWGARKLTVDNLKLVWAEFSTLS